MEIPQALKPFCLSLLVAAAAGRTGYPPADELRVQELFSQMSIEEKFLQTCIDSECSETQARWLKCSPFGGGSVAGGGDAWFALKDNDRLGIRGMRLRDGPKGMTCTGGEAFGPPCPEDGRSPSFPAQILRAATWNVELEEEVGQAVAEIAQLLDVHAALLPTINVLPWLNWGRAQETYGEDPVFSGKMGAAVVKGVQKDRKVMATVKHFLANNIENTRWWVSAEMSDKLLHEVYLKAWSIVVQESSPELIMTSYNRVQGKYPFAHPKFLSLLRDELGFDGSVMTDWFASWEAITSGLILGDAGRSSPYWGQKDFMESNSIYTAGVDMEMPFCSKNRDAISKVQACAVSSSEACATSNALDEATVHLLRSKSRYGLLGPPKNNSRPVEWDNHKFDKLILRVAQEGIVLLKNDNGFLPKKPSAVSSVVVLGSAETLELGDKGSSSVKESGQLVNVLEGLQKKYGSGKVSMIYNKSSESDAKIAGADMVVIDIGLDHLFEGEFLPPSSGGDRKYLNLHSWDIELIQGVASLNPNVVVVISAGASVIVEEFVDKVKGLLWIGYPGPLGGQALADILAGDVNPSGRMPVTTPKRAEDYLPKGINLQPWVAETADPAPSYPYSHGFKHMWEHTIEPRFPFGWGLSYSTFDFGAPTVSIASLDGITELTVSVQVQNTGATAGSPTVQVYATCQACRLKRQPIMLIGFKKVHLAASETRLVELRLDADELSVYSDTEPAEWILEKGPYDILVGPCADDKFLKTASISFAEDEPMGYAGKLDVTPGRFEAPGRDCASFQCTPAAESEYIKAWAVPSTLPYDPYMVLALGFARVLPLALMAPKTALCMAGMLICLLLYSCCRCCCRWLCRKQKPAVDDSAGKKKKS